MYNKEKDFAHTHNRTHYSLNACYVARPSIQLALMNQLLQSCISHLEAVQERVKQRVSCMVKRRSASPCLISSRPSSSFRKVLYAYIACPFRDFQSRIGPVIPAPNGLHLGHYHTFYTRIPFIMPVFIAPHTLSACHN